MSPEDPRSLIQRLEDQITHLEAEVRRLENEKNETSADYLEAVRELEKANKELEEIAKMPWAPTYFVNVFNKDKRLIEIDRGNQIVYLLKNSMLNGAEIKLETLRKGQIIWLAKGGGAILHVSNPPQFDACGDVWTFDAMRDDFIVAHHEKCGKAVIRRSADFKIDGLKPGDNILVSGGFVVGKVDLKKLEHMVMTVNLPQKDFSMVAGLEDEIKRIREDLITPFVYPDIAKEFQLPMAVEEDFMVCSLFYGPPGCGKTLLGEATAKEIMKKLQEMRGKNFKVGFILIRGTQLLEKWVGNTEEYIRDLFLNKATEFDLTIFFWDEFGAMFPPRGAAPNAPWHASHVSQFNSIVGGFRTMKRKAILIAADNRIDQIDPAVIRAGRFDIKRYIPRPKEAGAAQILEIYLKHTLPLHQSCFTKNGQTPQEAIRENLIAPLVERMYDPKSDDNKIIEVNWGSEKEVLGFKDLLVSGAVLEAIVKRAKSLAFNEWVEAQPRDESKKGIKFEHLLQAYEETLEESEHLPDAEKAMEDWLKIEGIEGQYSWKFLDSEKPRHGFV